MAEFNGCMIYWSGVEVFDFSDTLFSAVKFWIVVCKECEPLCKKNPTNWKVNKRRNINPVH